MSNFAERLKKLRKERGLSQKNLADIFNYSRTTISNYEHDKRLPDINVLCQLAQFFDVSTDYLIGRSNKKKSFFQQIRHDTTIVSFIINPDDASFVDCNLAAVNFFGYPKNVLLTKKVYETNLFSREKIRSYINDVLKDQKKSFIAQDVSSSGKVRDVQVTINPFFVKEKKLLYCVINDISLYLKENRNLHNTLLQMIEVTGQLSLRKSYYKENHQKRVAKIAVAIGKKMKLEKEQIKLLRISGLLHDLGEINIPGEIINKPTALSTTEYNLVKKHPEDAYDILKNIRYLKNAANIILQHHERIDGSGYPYNLIDQQIKMEAKIIAVADVIEALTSERSYRKAFKVNEAFDILIKGKGEKYDSEVVNACIEVFNESQGKY